MTGTSVKPETKHRSSDGSESFLLTAIVFGRFVPVKEGSDRGTFQTEPKSGPRCSERRIFKPGHQTSGPLNTAEFVSKSLERTTRSLTLTCVQHGEISLNPQGLSWVVKVQGPILKDWFIHQSPFKLGVHRLSD